MGQTGNDSCCISRESPTTARREPMAASAVAVEAEADEHAVK